MAKESKKDFNAMLYKETDMPKIQIVRDEVTIKKYGGERMFFAPPIAYDDIMKRIPFGKVVTIGEIRNFFAKQNDADFKDPMTACIFIVMAAWASFQRDKDITPSWRTLKANGELNY